MGEKIGAVAAAILVILAFCGVVSLIALGLVGVGNIAGLTIPFGAAVIITLALIAIVAYNVINFEEDDADEQRN